jgi:hypothetical protein
MNHAAKHPSLYQINTRVWLTAFSRVLGRFLWERCAAAIQLVTILKD